MNIFQDFIHNVAPLMVCMTFFCGLSGIVGWWRGYDSGHSDGYDDGKRWGYNYRDMELQHEMARIRLEAEKQERGYPCTECDKTTCTECCQVWVYCTYLKIKQEKEGIGPQAAEVERNEE